MQWLRRTAQKHGGRDRPYRSYPTPKVRGGNREHQAATAQEQPRGATPLLRPGALHRRSSIQSAKTRLGADWGSDRELLIAKFRLKLKKVGKPTRPFRYDLNHQIPYNYTEEVRNRFKGLDLIDRVPDELWTEVRDIVQDTGINTITMEKKCKRAKWLSGEALQIVMKRREAKTKGKRKDIRI